MLNIYQKGIFVSVESMHRTNSEHLHVLGICRFKKYSQILHRCNRELQNWAASCPEKLLCFTQGRLCGHLVSKHIPREKAYSCRGLEPAGTEAQGDETPPARTWKLHWASTSISGFDPTASKLCSICTYPYQLCLTSESAYSLEQTGQGFVSICLFGLSGSFTVASTQVTGLSLGVTGWHTMTCNMQEVSLGDLIVPFGLTLYEYSCKTNCLNPLPKRWGDTDLLS